MLLKIGLKPSKKAMNRELFEENILSVYCVEAAPEVLAEIRESFRVEERFSKTEWNFQVEQDQEDKFIELCDNLGVECELV